jgi:glycine/D-amino acid oxidase-like deaminating enzyme
MKLRSKEPYWLLKNGLLNSYQSLKKNISCDILIIGGGITGSLMAYQFSQEGYKTVLVDKRDIAFGSTSATTAMLQYELDTPLVELIEIVGEAAAIDTYKEGVNSILALEAIIKKIKARCDFKRKKSLYIAHTEKDSERLFLECTCRKKIGLDVKWLSREQIKKTYRIVSYGGILSTCAGSLDAYNLTHALLDYSRKNFSLQIYDHTSIEEVVYQENKNIAKTDNGSTVKCKRLIYATGYETQLFLKEKIVDLISTFAFVSEPLATMPVGYSSTIFWDTQDPYLYMRSTGDKRIIVGGADEQFRNAERRDKLVYKKEAALLKSVQVLIPGISIVPDFSWTGTFGVTRDALPYIGSHPSYPNSFFVLGFGGNGITFSVMGMRILSDAVAGRKNKFLEYFKFNR